MRNKLAIKGHITRGEEVIKLLEMIGGKNCYNFSGDEGYAYYVIEGCQKEIRAGVYIFGDEDMHFFTLEEFLDKYPFKVGDKVHVYVQNDDINGRYDVEVAEISSMRWNHSRCKIAYKMKDINREFYMEEIKCKAIDNSIEASHFMQLGKISAVCFNTENYENEVELKLGDYDIVVRDGKTCAVLKKPAYPKTYEECCKVLGYSGNHNIILITDVDNKLFDALYRLKVCRDVYWKIAGDWKPDWKDEVQTCYTIAYNGISVRCYNETDVYAKFAFPTEEMRDAFYENFKELIEECKELL